MTMNHDVSTMMNHDVSTGAAAVGKKAHLGTKRR